MSKRVIAVIVAVVLAMAGIVVLLVWANNAQTRAYEGAELTEVVQVQQQVPTGATATELAEATKVVEIPSSTVPEGAIRDLSEVAGLVTTTALQSGEVLLEVRMAEPGAATADLGGVPEGLQEISISLETAQLVAGDIAAGDEVGVMAGYDSPQQTVVVRDGVLVTGTNVADLGENAQGAAIITLAVNEDTAKRIAHAGLYGRVWLTKQNETTEHDDGLIEREDITR
ncbi:hypothetical protein ACHAAC_01605 [Aeromicrobium sp. CF4.19]|uniref:hypothetical protein n=1 Tax=Aeromicrobium sp. CF4.19 TaxID=3373082 RepID=UPI003EE81094